MASLDSRLKALEKSEPAPKLPSEIVISLVGESNLELLKRVGRTAAGVNRWIVLVRSADKRLLLERLH